MTRPTRSPRSPHGTAFSRALCVVAVLLGLSSTSSLAQDANAPTYNIELIVFRANGALGGAENWATEGGGIDDTLAGGESAGDSSQVGRFVGLLPPSQFQLNDIENKLRASGAYAPVAHIAWTQTASAWGTRAGFPLAKLGADVPGLAGNVFLERGQYLHLGMSISYSEATPPAGIGASASTTFVMNQSRRIRFYERNYYDHPAFGVIALVTPTQGKRPPGR
jgi:hypothetical protein